MSKKEGVKITIFALKIKVKNDFYSQSIEDAMNCLGCGVISENACI